MTPRSTYRVQLNRSFGFRDVASIAPYLARLGITHVYCSPYLQAQPGSTHGYDVVDHTSLNEELGGRAGFEDMVRALDEAGLKHIVDIVPNHVSIEGRANDRWWDVLKHGRASRYASWFDIDWNPPHEYLKNKVLVPVLGDELTACLQRGEIRLEREDDGWVVRYFEHVLPIDPAGIPADSDPRDVDLDELLARQHYALASWRRAARHLNYRRFFDINTLAALRVEQPEVFTEVHALVLDLIASGQLDGVRVDHIDGLREPARYLDELRAATDETYIVVEKILEPGEVLPDTWPVEGTTGYDFLNEVQGLFVDPAGGAPLDATYRSVTGEDADLASLTREKKFLIMRQVMASDLTRLTSELGRAFDDAGWDWDTDTLRVALAELIAALHVYRTYVTPDGERSDADRKVLADALATARSRCTYLDAEVFDRIETVMSFEAGGDQALSFMLRFQQTTGPIMAKGVEDTVLYNYNRFIALNEVGGDPSRFGTSVDAFHRRAEQISTGRPETMLATSTHDTKRSEDVRARLLLLSEIPDRWADTVERLSKIGERYRHDGMPDRNAEYLLLQTLVGAWPLSVDRAIRYMAKAAKEAKRYTSWTDPDPAYEDALERFVRGVLGDEEFGGELQRFVAPLVRPGRINSLAQTLVKLTHPGCPDIYQGTELWDLSLVDPDNRREVDYEHRVRLLDAMDGASDDPLGDDGRGKLFLTATALGVRARFPESFGARGGYAPITALGPRAEHVVAYRRGEDAIVAVPRLVMGLGSDWGGTTIAIQEGTWVKELNGGEIDGTEVQVDDLFSDFPVALLTRR